jgi:hypothetical protein
MAATENNRRRVLDAINGLKRALLVNAGATLAAARAELTAALAAFDA